jgi:beta-lactamase class A
MVTETINHATLEHLVEANAVRGTTVVGVRGGWSVLVRYGNGIMNGSILGGRYLPLLKEMFGDPGINHKFVKGLQEREGVTIYRKSGTWKNFHADSGVFVHDTVTYIGVAIDHDSAAARGMVSGIRIVDDLMLKRAARHER